MAVSKSSTLVEGLSGLIVISSVCANYLRLFHQMYTEGLSLHAQLSLSIFKNIFLFNLALPGLSCGVRDL